MDIKSENTLFHEDFSNIGNVNVLNVNVVSEIEKELEPCHVYSLVFLLYDVAYTALDRLTIYQRVSKDDSRTKLLSEWVLNEQNKNSLWRCMFIEALATCQLYQILKKLGLKVLRIKRHFQPHSFNSIYLNPIRKALYVVCENIVGKQLTELKGALGTYDINVREYETCELVFLKVMCENFDSKEKNAMLYLTKLSKVVERIPGLTELGIQLRNIENGTNKNGKDGNNHDVNPQVVLNKCNNTQVSEADKVYCHQLDEIFDMFNKLTDSDLPECDSKLNKTILRPKEVYPLKNKNRLGVCYIINQEEFEDPELNRIGSCKDSLELKKTMEYLKFEVITHSNLNHKSMMKNIKDIIRYRVQHDDSVFILCILSHGIKDHVFASDTVPVKIDDIQNLLYTEDANHLYEIPKIILIEACQIEDTSPRLVADSPKFQIRKSNCLIYYATASQLEAYRHPKYGTIFIQMVCRMLKKYADQDDVMSIFTRANHMVRMCCEKRQKEQIPSILTTLEKKLYLK